MRESVPKKMRKKFADLFEEQMAEIKERYLEEIRKVSMRSVLHWMSLDGSGDCLQCTADSSYVLPGKTENYPKYLKNRVAIRNKYYLSHRLPRAIVSKAAYRLPHVICDLRNYRELGYVDFRE